MEQHFSGSLGNIHQFRTNLLFGAEQNEAGKHEGMRQLEATPQSNSINLF